MAAEPDVVSPVAMAWDPDGRLFVAEMSDYPNATSGGRIRMLEDRDGDGRYERATVFAENLPFPNGVLPWNGGILVTAAPDIWFLKDIDGDGRADERHELFTGFGQGNQQLRVNGLMWGLDNWIYGANGRSEGDVRAVEVRAGSDWARLGPLFARTNSIRGHDFRFRPGSGEFETIAGRSQFGQARDDWGNRFLSWNTIPIRHEVLPERYLRHNPLLPPAESLLDVFPADDPKRVFQISPLAKKFNDEPPGYFNASCGLSLLRGPALGPAYYGNAFVCEPLRNLVHRRVLSPEGVTFAARRAESDREFLAATDPWFHPVNLATGPDGALYVADFYRLWVEHPEFVHNEAIEKTVAWRTGADHGRIWRIRRRDAKHRREPPRLSRATTGELVKLLEHENGWWRDTAQQLLVQRRDSSALAPLRRMAGRSAKPEGRVQALWTLEGLEAVDTGLLEAALRDPHARVRENAVRLGERFLAAGAIPPERAGATRGGPEPAPGPELVRSLLALAADADPRVRFQLALTLGEWESDRTVDTLAALARVGVADPWQATAVLSAVGSRPWPFLRRLLELNPGWLSAPDADQAAFLDRLAGLIGAGAGAGADETGLAGCLALANQPASDPDAAAPLAILAGLADGLDRSNRSLRELMRQPPPSLEEPVRGLDRSIARAAKTAVSDPAALPARLAAIRILGRVDAARSGPVLLDLMLPPQPAEVQSAATRALGAIADARLATAMFANWSRYSRRTRGQLLTAALRTRVFTAALLDALEQGRLAPVELDPYTRSALSKVQDAETRPRVERLLKPAESPDRERVIREYRPALELDGDGARGAALFAGTCMACHAIQGRGRQVGPDLSGVGSHPKETLLIDILDPSRTVLPDYVNYILVTTDGDTVSGLIEAETPSLIVLRRPGEPDTTFPRSRIRELRAEGKSPMPEGLEQGWSRQDLADLLAFLGRPDAGLLPKEP